MEMVWGCLGAVHTSQVKTVRQLRAVELLAEKSGRAPAGWAERMEKIIEDVPRTQRLDILHTEMMDERQAGHVSKHTTPIQTSSELAQ